MPKKLTKEELELLKDSGYSEKVIELYRDKVNVGLIKNPDVNLTHTGPCGDTMKLYLKVNDNGVIEDAEFQCLGCPGAISSSSAITRIAKGKTLEDAKRITEHDILQDLGGLPESKINCSKLAVTTLRKAIAEYEDRKTRPSQLQK